MANEKRLYNLDVELKGEIRKVESITNTFKNKNGEDITTIKNIIYVDDVNDQRIYLTEKDATRLPLYKRGVIGIFKLRIACEEEFGVKAKIQILDFVPVEE